MESLLSPRGCVSAPVKSFALDQGALLAGLGSRQMVDWQSYETQADTKSQASGDYI